MNRFGVILICSALLLSFKCKEKKEESSKSLFKIERNKDSNQIFYDLGTISEDRLNKENPINIYWRRNTEGGKIKPLTWIQQNYAYGLDFTYSSENIATFHFVCSDKVHFTLKKDVAGKYRVFTIQDEKEMIVNRIFIQIDGGTFWVPKISRVELHTNDPITNTDEVKIINP